MNAEHARQPESTTPAAATVAQGLSDTEREQARVLFERARRGDPAVRQQLNELLNQHPRLWRVQGDIGRALEQMLIGQIARGDLLIEGSIRRRLEELKQTLGGNEDNALERLLIDRVVVAWLGTVQAEMAEVGDTNGSAACRFRLQRAESANRRFNAATKALATVRRLGAGIRLEVRHVAAPPTATAKPEGSMPDRLKDLLSVERELESKLTGVAV